MSFLVIFTQHMVFSPQSEGLQQLSTTDSFADHDMRHGQQFATRSILYVANCYLDIHAA